MSVGKVELVIEGERPVRLASAFREFWAYRRLVLAFAERNVRVKYKQTVLGIAWAVLQPLAMLAIFVVFFGRVANISSGDIPYAAFSMSALVPWTFLQTAVSFGAQALIMDGVLLRKVYFPREVPVVGTVLSAGIDFAIVIVLFLMLAPVLGANLSWTVVLAIPLWGILVLLATGLSLAFGAMNVYYRDFRYALPFGLQLWMFASPVAYPVSLVPEQWRALYVVINPAAGVLDGFRRVLAAGTLPDPTLIGISLASSLFIFLVGYRLFKAMEPRFADVI